MARFTFYNTQRWKNLRQRIIDRADGICEECHAEKGTIVHHKEEVTEKNINDPYIVWGEDNLICIGVLCHARHHHGESESVSSGLMFDKDGNLIEFEKIKM